MYVWNGNIYELIILQGLASNQPMLHHIGLYYYAIVLCLEMLG